MKKNLQAKTHKRFSLAARLIAAGLIPAALATSFVSVGAAGNEVTLQATKITSDKRDYSWVEKNTETHTYDFTDTTITTYSKDEKLANLSLRTNMVFDGNTLSCKPGKTFSFGSAIFLGDDYGIQGGELSLDLDQTGGIFSIGVRLSKKAAKNVDRGIWFTSDGAGTLTISSPGTKLKAQIGNVPSSGHVIVRDQVDSIELQIGNIIVARVKYDSSNGAMTVTTSDGTAIGTEVKKSDVQCAGFFTLFADSMVGTIDNVSFTHTTMTRTTPKANYKMDFGTWVATDDRDRTTPTSETTGTVNANKQVGVFYFINHTGNSVETPLDNTLLYNTLGLDGMKAHLSDTTNMGAYYWAEPYFGYYMNNDTWVKRKHAYMLESAGVDFIFVDISNGAAYPDAILALLDTWKQIRDEGGSTPDICFLAHGKLGAVWSTLWDKVYDEDSAAKYSDLFYEYKGKPLLLGELNSIENTTERSKVSDYFTIRSCWAWTDKNNSWNWLQEYKVSGGTVSMFNGGWGRDSNGNREQLALCMGHHPTMSKGRSYINGQTTSSRDFGFSMDSGAGLGFANQFEAIKKYDPDMLLITGWNEWTAGLDHGDGQNHSFAGTSVPFSFVDQFNTEFSRDGEPMKLRDGEGSGFGDNYYYQMAGYIREFKGWKSTTKATGQTTIQLGDANAWANVGPTYTDFTGDATWRNSTGYFGGYTYVDNSARNDLTTAKVSQDSQYLYFMVNTAQDVVVSNDSAWMNLFLNVDGNNTNGWEGFDFVLNRDRDGHYVSVESLAGGWRGQRIGQALYTVDGNTMTIRVAKSVLGLSGTTSEFLFKWADNSTRDGDIMEFMDKGDTAPNDRYAFRYLRTAGGTDTPNVEYTLKATDGSSVALRDESQPLPPTSNNDYEDEDPPVDSGNGNETDPTDPGDTQAPPADTEDNPVETDPNNEGEETSGQGLIEPPKGGCGSVLGAGLIAIPTALFATWAFCRKKKED